MKKSLLISGILLVFFVGGFAQQTAAPDQGNDEIVTDVTNSASTNEAVSNETATNAEPTNVVTEEKEVQGVSANVYNDGKIDYYGPGVKFVINAKDNGSGVKAVYYMADDGMFGLYEKPFGFMKEGRHVIAYKVKDNVGNVSSVKAYDFILDLTAPWVDLSSDKKPVILGNVVYVSSNYNFGISAMDNLSGVKSISYKIDDGTEQEYKGAFAPIGTNGMHKVTYKAEDNVGNVSEEKTFKYFMDINPPTIKIETSPAVYEKDGKKYISDSALISIIAKDNETKVSKIVYSIDGGDLIDYTHPFKLKAGAHKITAKAYDLVGNVSKELIFDVEVDAENPEGSLTTEQ